MIRGFFFLDFCTFSFKIALMKIAVIGADGQLGNDIVRVLKDEEIVPLTIQDMDIADFESVNRTLGKISPALIINTAAFTNVKECEKNDREAYEVNGIGAKNLAIVCKRLHNTLFHISTDYVFDGEKGSPYIETDIPCPLNVYGLSKLAGEYYIRYILENYFIVRTSGLYGIHTCIGKGGNFIDTMVRFSKEKDEIKVVDDEVLTPTYTLDLSQQIKALIKTNFYGIYHITNEGECSWYEFAKAIFTFLDFNVNLKRVNSKEFPSSVRRPRYSVLENRTLKKLKLNRMRPWQEALKDYIEERKEKGMV